MSVSPAYSTGPRQVHVVVHTHWDREWYLTREATLARCVQVMQQVLAQLEDSTLPSFLFDGQTAAFDDLLAVAPPQMAQRLLKQAAAGRLVLGPWYVMADGFLVSGESLLRNLEMGLQDAERLAPGIGAQRVGYLPDSFGHAAQMPQLLAQFGVSLAVLWRGADAPQNTFNWVGPDGTATGTVWLPEGYYQHPLNLPQWREPLTALLAKLLARTPNGPLLLTQGGDHLAPAPHIAQRMAQFNTSQTDYQLRFSTLAEHCTQALAANPLRAAIAGELRHNVAAFVLPDVLSTRRYLKLAHQQCEDRLLAETEPLVAAFLAPTDFPNNEQAHAALQRAWRLLVQQQAHDSICGCSLDAVHAEMQQRFVQLQQQLDAVRQQVLAACNQGTGAISLHRHGGSGIDVFADDSSCTLFNPVPLARSGWWQVTVFLRGDAHAALRVTGPAGKPLPCVLISCQAGRELVSPLDDFPEPITGHHHTLAVHARLAGLGSLALQVHGVDSIAEPGNAEMLEPTISNAAWHVAVNSAGELLLTDKLNGTTALSARPAISLLWQHDAGDSYNFSPPHLAPAQAPGTLPDSLHTTRWQVQSTRHVGALQELVLNVTQTVPAALNSQRTGAGDGTATNTGTLVLRLLGDEPYLRAQLRWANHAQDQRTRLLLPLLLDTGSLQTDTAFTWTARPAVLAQVPAQPSRSEMPVAVMPSLSAVAAGPWAIAHRAMHECEVLQHAGQRWLGLTLVRSVGWLSRRDLRTRGVGAGPDIATPGAQCLTADVGQHIFDFWLCAGNPATDPDPTRALQAAERLRRPPLLLRGHPSSTVAADTANPVLMTSSVRRIRSKDGKSNQLEIRLYNPTGQPQPVALQSPNWQVVRADGQACASQPGVVQPHQIVALRQRLQNPA
jgi:mannosylglycerate hydrolase